MARTLTTALMGLLLGMFVLLSTTKAASEVKAFVDETIAQNKVAVFSKSYCGFSMRAKNLIRSLVPEDELKIVELDQHESGPAIQDYMMKLTGGRTVPRVFVGGAFVGGSDDVAALHSAGKLVAKLKEAGVSVLGEHQAEL